MINAQRDQFGQKHMALPLKINMRNTNIKNLYLIPTEGRSRLGYITKRGKEFGDLRLFDKFTPNILDSENQNLYITSDGTVGKNNYFLSLNDDESYMEVIKNELDDFRDYAEEDWLENCRKVVLTTDVDLTVDGVQTIGDDFLMWFIKNPGVEYVKVTEKFSDPFDGFGYEIPMDNPVEMQRGITIINADKLQFKNNLERIMELKTCLEKSHELLHNAKEMDDVYDKVRTLIRDTLASYDQNRKFITG